MTTADATESEPSVREQLAGMFSFFRRALRFWRLLLVTVVLGGLGLAAFLKFHQAQYRSETVILYVEKGSTEQDTESSDAQRSVTLRLKELLYARPNLERIISTYNLYGDLRHGYGAVDAVEELKKHVEFRAPGGDTFSIAFQGSTAKEAQGVTAELGRLVIDGDAELRKNQTKVALDFLVGERQTREGELRSAEEQLASFMAEHPRFALDATPLASGAAIRATMGAAPAPGAAASRPFVGGARRVEGLPAAPGAPASAPLAPVRAGDGEESRARAALAAARETLTEKLVHYTPAHPDVRAAEGEVQRATARLAALTGKATATEAPAPAAEPAAAASAAPRPAPAAPRAAWSPRAAAPTPATVAQGNADLVELETEWLKLTRGVSEARRRLDQIEAQLFRANMQASNESGGNAVQVTVIDPAFLPQRPLPPGNVTVGLIFLAASLMLGGMLMMLRAMLDERVFEARDVASVAEVLVEVPRNRGRNVYVAS